MSNRRNVFVKAKCGCVGIVLDDDEFLCLKACDTSEYEGWFEISMFTRNIDERNRVYTPLSSEEEAELVNKLCKLVSCGNSYNSIRHLLAIPDERR